LEYGIQLLSDWALLNRARAEQLEPLGYPSDRDLVEVFHAVYRRDRRNQRPHGVRGCPDPTQDQLKEMLNGLRERGANINSPEDLMRSLKRVAKQLRQYQAPLTEPFEAIDSSTGEVMTKEFPDPQSRNDLDEIEQQELRDFCSQQFLECLQQSIEQGFRDRINAVLKSPRRAAFAPQVKLGLQLLYSQGMSQQAIAQRLGMTQSQVSRLLQPEELLSKVRFLTVEKLLHCILKKAEELGLTTIPPAPDYLSNLMQQLEAFVDEQVFLQASAEIRTVKNGSMGSLYAQHLCQYLENYEG
jgi:transcriptional regulator with XRE-family HTH domain